MRKKTNLRMVLLLVAILLQFHTQAQKKPNILIIFPDDVGWSNVSAYGNGVMGYTTPNIDRIAKEGVMFTEHYAQPSCTAGRAALITGQYPIRSGMTTVGRPGGELGLKKESPTLAEVLKEQGYATGQFGKNHLGDRNEHLPTVHGFDEFFGNLYHLNTQEEYQQVDYPQDPEYFKKYGTRGVLHTWATKKDDPTVDPRFGRVGKQKIEDTGQLSRERMKTVDEEFIEASLDFMKRAKDDDKPFFVWLNPSRMHMFTHLKEENRYLAAPYTTEHDFYGSGMMEHDQHVGMVLDELEKMGVLDNTIVIYSTDNGPEHSARTHGGTTPFRGEKMTTYEGGVRVPMMVMWKDQIPEGRTLRGIQAHMDIFTTLAAAAGVDNVGEKMIKERKQYIDGVNNLDYWTGDTEVSARNNFIYYHESDIRAVRINQWKLHFQTSENYYATYVKQKFPIMYNLHFDPYESFDNITDRSDIIQRKQFLNEPIQELLGEHIQSLIEYPPVQKAATFDFSELMKQLMAGQQ
ncbi:arylsulfatase [Reichenbachiella ulvae]|uniref:Arylsulfatase n=1 Tax=Reichenbachiella ulvae TaxID=2980104 RepID=A0ABT3CU03_9BACT|nr:arylsulfatase [Reichenbachiella ulvae]MCV9387153.1 arylsulfatase [Reichenbachiella ulvae]